MELPNTIGLELAGAVPGISSFPSAVRGMVVPGGTGFGKKRSKPGFYLLNVGLKRGVSKRPEEFRKAGHLDPYIAVYDSF